MWPLPRALSCQPGREVEYRERIRRSVKRLGQLANECEQLNSNISQAIAESHRILDNPFLTPKAFLASKAHMVSLKYSACADIGWAVGAKSEYIEVMQELLKVEDMICEDLLHRLEVITTMSKRLFRKALDVKEDCVYF
jgi:hypothetical protein